MTICQFFLTIFSFLQIAGKDQAPWKRFTCFLGLLDFEDGMNADDYKERVSEMVGRYVPIQSVFAVTLDNCSTMLKLGAILGISNHLNCSIHAIQSCVDKAVSGVPSFASVVTRCKAIIHDLTTTRGAVALNQAQDFYKSPQRRLSSPGETRWDSEFDALRRLQEEMQAVQMALLHRKRQDLLLSEQEMGTMENLLRLLEPMKKLTMALQNRDTCISSVHSVIMKIRSDDYGDDTKSEVFLDFSVESNPESCFKAIIISEMRERLNDSFSAPTSVGCISSVFREKYKRLRYLGLQQQEKTWTWIRDASSKINLEVVLPDPVQACVEKSSHRKLTNFTADSLMDDDEEASDTSVGQLGQSAEDEIKAYREWRSMPDDRELSAIEWWCKFGYRFPRLLILAKRFLAVQATSAESERSFSLCGQISTKLRANLSGVNLENLAFFKANDQQLQNDDVQAEVIVDNKDDSDPSVVTTSS